MKKEPRLSRREFLSLGGFAAVSLGLPRWARAAADAARRSGKTLVVVLQRGALDGLNVVIPFRDPVYRKVRPTIAIPAPGRDGGALDLDGTFGLHPKLSALLPLYREGRLAFVQAAGSPNASRSHTDAQNYMEAGTPGLKVTEDGWLDRALTAGKVARDPLAAVAISARLPLILRGRFPALALPRGDQLRGTAFEDSLSSLYDDASGNAFFDAARDLGEARKQLDSMQDEGAERHAAGYPEGSLGQDLFALARILKAGLGTRVGFVDSVGWDHHIGESGPYGLGYRLEELGGAIAAFYRHLGSRAEDVVLITMTEFGRTVEENGSGGTDHGHGSVMMVLGGEVKGGRVYGRWPGLDPAARFESRDLEVTTDFRGVAGEVLAKQLGLKDLSSVFPGGTWPFLGLM